MEKMKEMKNLWLKNIPQAVYVRKGLMYGIIGFIAVIALAVFIGLNNKDDKSSKDNNKSSKSDVKNIANNSDADWVKNAAQGAQNTATPAQQTASPVNSAKLSSTVIKSQKTTQNIKVSSQNEALLKDMSAPITANQLTSDINNNAQAVTNNIPSLQTSGEGVGGQGQESHDDQNRQAEKKAFLEINGQPNLKDDYLGASLQNPLSQYELQAGTIIPGILITGINSDLPGQITGQVRSNVYDSISGKYLLIPQGAKLTGLYDSQITYGQERVLIAWKRIIFPNGKSIDLQGMPGVDISGYAGFNDQVNNHYFKIFGSVILMSVLSAGAQLSQPQQNSNPFIVAPPTVGQTVAQSLGTNIANTATMLTQKNINIQPILVIRPGYEFNISVTKDMVFPGPYAG